MPSATATGNATSPAANPAAVSEWKSFLEIFGSQSNDFGRQSSLEPIQ
jgi:hypothetical protein